MRIFLTTLFFLSFNAYCITEKQVTTYLQQRMEETKAPSLSFAIAKDNKLLLASAVGFANKKEQKLASTATKYRTGSVAKVIGTTAFMTLVEQGKVSLNDDIHQYLSFFPEKNWPIKIQHLLTHTSGIRHYRFGEYGTNIHYPTLKDAAEVFMHDELLFEPGTRYEYSTYGINLIQGIIEQQSGKTLENFIDQTVWQKAGMNNTELEIAGRAQQNYATGYRSFLSHLPVKPIDVSNKYIGGGMRSTPSDLVNLVSSINKGKILTDKTREVMFSVPYKQVAPERMMGWRTFSYKGMKAIGHGGAVNGFESYLMHLPELGITAALMVNQDDYDYTSSTLHYIVDMLIDEQKPVLKSKQHTIESVK